MKKPVSAFLQRSQALLALVQKKAGESRVRWRSKDLGSWGSLGPKWWVQGGKIYFRFRGQGSGPSLWISSAKPKPWGVRLFLASARIPIPEAFDVAWQESETESISDAHRLWKTVRYWLRCKFPTHQIMRSSKRSDLAHSLSGLFLRVLFRYRGKDCLLIAADVNVGQETHLAVGQALLWALALRSKKQLKAAPMITFLFLQIARRYLSIAASS